MVITNWWIGFNTTRNYGWTAAQLRLIGVSWPPPEGWRLSVIGKTIPDWAAREFERLGRVTKQRPKKPKNPHMVRCVIEAKRWDKYVPE